MQAVDLEGFLSISFPWAPRIWPTNWPTESPRDPGRARVRPCGVSARPLGWVTVTRDAPTVHTIHQPEPQAVEGLAHVHRMVMKVHTHARFEGS
jgi:hypothetical protein